MFINPNISGHSYINKEKYKIWRKKKKPDLKICKIQLNWIALRVCVWDCTSGLCCWTRWHDPLCPVLSCRYPGPVCRVGGWDELLWHEDQPQQRHLPPLPATQQSTGHWVRQVRAENAETHTYTHQISQSHSHKHSLSSYRVIVYIPKQKQTRPICSRLKYYANAAAAKMPLTAARREWKQSNCVWNKDNERLGFRRNWSSGPHFCTSSRVLPPTLSGRSCDV